MLASTSPIGVTSSNKCFAAAIDVCVPTTVPAVSLTVGDPLDPVGAAVCMRKLLDASIHKYPLVAAPSSRTGPAAGPTAPVDELRATWSDGPAVLLPRSRRTNANCVTVAQPYRSIAALPLFDTRTPGAAASA